MNKLTRLKDFETALRDYQIAGDSKDILEKTKLVALTGLSSSGRNTIIRELERDEDYYFIISDTTRRPRSNDGIMEKDGREYWFRSEDDMLADIQNGKLLEAEIIHAQQVSGISIREILKAQKANKIAITDMDIGGALNVLEAKPNAIVILVLPPSFDEWLRRMNNRGEMPKAEQYRRLETAQRILEIALEASHFVLVVNHDHHDSAGYIDSISHDISVIDHARQTEGKSVIHELLTDTKEYLEDNN